MMVGRPKYVAQIPPWFSARTAAQVVAFFAAKAGGRINVLRATKMVYLADRASMAERDHPITGDNFVSMPFGPVNTYTYSFMKHQVDSGLDEWGEFVGPKQGHDIPLARPISADDLDELGRSDLRILESTWERFKDIEKYELAEWTHAFCPEWQDPGESSIPIDFATVFKKLHKPEPIELAEQVRAERHLAMMLTA